MPQGFAAQHPKLVEALADRSLMLERDELGQLVVDVPGHLGLVVLAPTCEGEALDRIGLPAGLAAAFSRTDGRITLVRESAGYVARIYDEVGWLGAAGAEALDETLAACARSLATSLAALAGRVPIPVRMSEFMQTARFGPIGIGTTMAEVEALLGPPEHLMEDDDAPWDHHRASIWAYHDYEFYFDVGARETESSVGPPSTRRVYQISRSALMYHVEPVPSRAFVIDFDFLVDGRRPSAAELEAQVRALGLEFAWRRAHGERVLVLASGVYFMFESQWPEDEGPPLACYIGCNPDYVAWHPPR